MAMVRKTAAQLKNFRMSKSQQAALDALTEEEINAAASGDPDNPPSTKEELARMARIVRRRGRPALQDNERKVRLTLRLPPEVVKYFRAEGPGWQSRISETLANHVKKARGRR
jgi:uncharacterized protein (DUF4415 family)